MAALLIASPATSKGGPVVRLKAGSWVIKCKGIVDSLLHLNIGDSTLPLRETHHKIVLSEPAEAQVVIIERGKEEYVAVIAECQRCQ